jgi:integrase/recombinase XerD
MAWRRKPDGRPYADVFIDGVRRRVTLLRVGEKAIDDATAEARYRAVMDALGKGRVGLATNGKRVQSLAFLMQWYTDVAMVARGNRLVSIDTNRVIFRNMAAFFEAHGITTVAELAANPGVIDEYVVDRRRVSAPATIVKELARLRAMFRAAYERGMIEALPVRCWPKIKIPDAGYPEPLSRDDFRRLLAELDKEPHTGRCIRFMAFTGCRSSDAVGLKKTDLQDLDTDEPIALLRQLKTGRHVAIALSPPAVEAIRAALADRHTSKFVFVDAHGKSLGAKAIQSRVARAARRIGLEGVSSKSFRQSLVSVLYDAGADDLLVRRITGHQSQAIGAYRRLRKGAAHALAKQYADSMNDGDGGR